MVVCIQFRNYSKPKSVVWFGFNYLSNENEWLIDFVDAMPIKVGNYLDT